MDYTILGRTGLKVSVAGLGCGGGSRLGQSQGHPESHSVQLVRDAFDGGVTFFDTAQAYGTEEIVGKGVAEIPRDQVVLSSKCVTVRDGAVISPADLAASLEQSLRNLRTDHIDVFHLHAVVPEFYHSVVEQLLPELLRQQDLGKIRYLGITESGPRDHHHEMLQLALPENNFDVVMLGFNMMNQNARTALFPMTQAHRVGTLIMFAVRSVFSVPGRLKQDVDALVASGALPDWLGERENPLDFLLQDGGAESIIDAAYRYVRHDPGSDVVLFGTGSSRHLADNIQSILNPSLRAADIERLHALFSELKGVGFDFPEKRPKRLDG